MLSWNLMHMKEALGQYKYILLDGKRWSAWHLVKVRRTPAEDNHKNN